MDRIKIVLKRTQKQLNEYIDRGLATKYVPSMVQYIFIDRVVRGVKVKKV